LLESSVILILATTALLNWFEEGSYFGGRGGAGSPPVGEQGAPWQKVPFRRGFRPLLNGSYQIFNLVGVLNPWLLSVAQRVRAFRRRDFPFSIAALCLR